ncbi:L-ribulokinase [Geomicrobium halophilum]|uniref:Ribulokinase n=1 Tax=Geomicrobium halophilum TaxID=549000 RepID=A0A841PUG8_9BACL|nr:ribulokinase [Geomicrobium halophilum]MBB6451394.1 L-ribulokinase [Geomicrobium halophilum]
MQKSYVIGVDFGTESCRALLVDVANGDEIATATHMYSHGVLSKELPNGVPLPSDWALQHPNDYIDGFKDVVRNVFKAGNIQPNDVIGIGIDFTSSTILPLDEKGDPLCLHAAFETHPHSWVKLWKHHAAKKEADEVTNLAHERGEKFIKRYGGNISSEWMIPKILQVVKEDPEVFHHTNLFMEAGDWLVYHLTGSLIRSSNTSSYKALWDKREGYPSYAFFSELHPEMKDILETKLRGEVRTIGGKAGGLNKQMAMMLGLNPGTAIAVNVIDAHAAVPAVGAVHPGQFTMAIGTSTCHMLVSEEDKFVQGVCGIAEDGIIPGYISYETGQVAVGDLFSWFVDNAIPSDIEEEAKKQGISVHSYLEEKAMELVPGKSGLVALDWWNGNRSILVDSDLSGVIVGLTLTTTPEEIYRALLESTAFGTRKIIETFKDSNIPVKEVFACGGIPKRNKLLLQIYADILNCEITIANSNEITALGTSMYAATAAGKSAGGYDTIFQAASNMSKIKEEVISPNQRNVERYNYLYSVYLKLHDYFGSEQRNVMNTLNNSKHTEINLDKQ